MAVPLAISAAGGIAKGLGDLSGAKQARREIDEQIRRKALEDRATLAEGEAAGAASGIEGDSGSLRNYLDVMDAEFARQRDWMRKSGYAQASAMKKSALFGALTGGVGSFYQYGSANNWWQQSGGGAAKPTYTPGSGQPPWRP